MSGSSQSSSSAADPWLPTDDVFNTIRNQASSTITPFFTNAIGGAGEAIGRANDLPTYATGFTDTVTAAQDPTARSAAFDQLKTNVSNDVMQGVNSTFGASGMTGSSLHQQNLARGLTEGLATVENDAYQQGEDRALQAANLSNTALGEAFNRELGVAGALQGQATTVQGAETNAINSLLSAATGNASQTTSSTSSPGLLGVLGAGAQIASLFTPSDERLKTDEKRVGEMDDGTPIYTYKYKDGAAPSPDMEGMTIMGVMAQKVKNKKAVRDDPNGFKSVNYGEL